MLIFTLVAAGQIVSFTGSAMTSFALGTWVYQRTLSTTLFGLILLFALLPSLIIAPLTGVLVDRRDRRMVMILSDAGSGLCTTTMLLLLQAGRLEVWHIFLAMGLSSVFHGFRVPAYNASVSVLVPQEQLGRANGIMQFGETSRYLFAPILAGSLMGIIGVTGVMLVDLATFLFAILTCLVVRFPRPKPSAIGQTAQGSLLHEALFGWRFIVTRAGLWGLMVMFALSNYATLLVDTVLPPMLLNRASPQVVGSVLTSGGAGMLLGSIVMGVWGGPKRRIHGVLGFLFLIGLFIVLMGLLQSVPLIAVATLGYYFPFPLMNACDQAIWQSRVPADVQGRVFSIKRMIALSMIPLAYVTAGPLADGVFEPLITPDGPLSGLLGPIIGVGRGRGMGLLISLMGVAVILVMLGAALNPHVRKVEDEPLDVPYASAPLSRGIEEPS